MAIPQKDYVYSWPHQSFVHGSSIEKHFNTDHSADYILCKTTNCELGYVNPGSALTTCISCDSKRGEICDFYSEFGSGAVRNVYFPKLFLPRLVAYNLLIYPGMLCLLLTKFGRFVCPDFALIFFFDSSFLWQPNHLSCRRLSF